MITAALVGKEYEAALVDHFQLISVLKFGKADFYYWQNRKVTYIGTVIYSDSQKMHQVKKMYLVEGIWDGIHG